MSDRLRAIDALIAVHCMGWRLSPSGKTWRTIDTEGIYRSGWNHRDFVRNWRPSTDPAASKQARDKMAELGYAWQLTYLPMGPFSVRAEFWTPPATLQSYFHVEDVTEELAVALAILAALQIEVPE